MHDIRDKADIEGLLAAFYTRAIPDPIIGHFFTEVAPLDLGTHLPKLTAFWEQVLFGTGDYAGNPMQVHLHIHALSAFQPQHFERWLSLFHSTLDARHQGPVAALAKQRAEGIAAVMAAKTIGQS